MINARFNERRTDANRGDILSSHDKNQIHVHNHARVHTESYVSVIIEPFWSFCVISSSYTMGCPPVRGDNPRALASGLSYVQVGKHGITILYHPHQCRPCTSRDISC